MFVVDDSGAEIIRAQGKNGRIPSHIPLDTIVRDHNAAPALLAQRDALLSALREAADSLVQVGHCLEGRHEGSARFAALDRAGRATVAARAAIALAIREEE